MARRKKRSVRQKEASASEKSAGSSPARLPPARPPRRNLPLLALSIALFAAWLVVLVILAVSRWPTGVGGNP